MARRRDDNPTAHALEEIQSFGDHLVEGISANPKPVIAVIVAIFAAAAAAGTIQHVSHQRAESASAELAAVRLDYIEALGGDAGTALVQEPANAELARSVRTEYGQRFRQIARERAGTPAGPLAWLEVGAIERQLGNPDGAIEAWEDGLADTDADSLTRPLLYERIAQVHEDAGRFAEAGAAYESAGDSAVYPLRYLAMAQAARCFADAGDPQRAVALFKRIQAEAPETPLPDYLSSRLRELEARPAAPESAS